MLTAPVDKPEFLIIKMKLNKNIIGIVIIFFGVLIAQSSFAQLEDLHKKIENVGENSNEAANLLFEISKVYYAQNNYPKALQYSRQAMDIYVSNNNQYKIAVVLQFKGDIYLAINDFNMALDNYLNAQLKFEDLVEEKMMAENSLKMSSVYLHLNNYKKALSDLFYSRNFFEKNKDLYKVELINTYTTIGSAFGYLEKTDSALYYFEKAMTLTPKSDLFQKGILLNNMGAIYSKKDNHEKAFEKYSEAFELVKTGKNRIIKGVTLSNIAFLYKKQGIDSAAIRIYLQALDTLHSSGDLTYIKDVYDNLSEIYERNENFEEALIYFHKFLKIKDSITSVESINKIADLESRYEIARMDKQIEIIKRENELKTIRQYVIIGGLTLFLIVGFLIYRNLRINYKNEKLKEKILEKEKLNLQNEIVFKNKELENFALRVIQKNEFLEKLKNEISNLRSDTNNLKDISDNISKNLYIDKDKQELEIQIRNIQKSFFFKLNQHFPDLTEYEKRLCSFIVLDLSLKDIAMLTNISPDSVKKSRYRLRQKLGLDSSTDSLNDFLKNI